jgi:hypothetical protein
MNKITLATQTKKQIAYETLTSRIETCFFYFRKKSALKNFFFSHLITTLFKILYLFFELTTVDLFLFCLYIVVVILSFFMHFNKSNMLK